MRERRPPIYVLVCLILLAATPATAKRSKAPLPDTLSWIAGTFKGLAVAIHSVPGNRLYDPSVRTRDVTPLPKKCLLRITRRDNKSFVIDFSKLNVSGLFATHYDTVAIAARSGQLGIVVSKGQHDKQSVANAWLYFPDAVQKKGKTSDIRPEKGPWHERVVGALIHAALLCGSTGDTDTF